MISLKHKSFKNVIRRKTPCIICIEDEKDTVNKKIHQNIISLCSEFPFVLCYKININDYDKYHLNKSTYGPNNLIRFECGKIKTVVDGNNYTEMYKLFWQVYVEACAYSYEGYIYILNAENRLPFKKKMRFEEKDLDFVESEEGGIISKYLEYENKEYPTLVFSPHKNCRHNIHKKTFIHPKINISLRDQKKSTELTKSKLKRNKQNSSSRDLKNTNLNEIHRGKSLKVIRKTIRNSTNTITKFIQ